MRFMGKLCEVVRAMVLYFLAEPKNGEALSDVKAL